ncbi:MAG: beta-lactamase family protein [Blastocatellia bacterium]|nr:beta-lactamase family protein [Blastocatellia bacterium]
MIERLRIGFLTAMVVLLAAAPLAAQKAQELPPDAIKKIEEVVRQEQARQKIPGLSVAIAVDNKLRYSKGFGMSDLEHSVPAKANSVYRTASIAKSMTATAVMQLAEQGKLDLDAPVQKYCPSFPEKQWPVTTRQLLGHLGGVRHYAKPGEASGTAHYDTIAESLALFKDESLLHEPGTKFTYTTYGYSVLGCAIEGASGMTYEDYMRERVFKPAGMNETGLDNFRLVIPNRSRGYMKLDQQTYNRLPEAVKRQAKVDGIYNASLHDTSMKVPGGGIVSTAEDLVRFAITINTGALVKRDTLDQMWIRQKTKGGEETNYGLGWGVGETNEGHKVVSHSGGQAGTSTLLVLIPEKGLAIAVMSNLERASLGSIIQQIRNILLPPEKESRSR